MKHPLVMSLSLLSLLWSLVDSETEFPYVSFRGETLLNHGYVDLSLVGDAEDGGDSVQCHTDLMICCRETDGIGDAEDERPDWYFPNGTEMGFSSGGDDIYQLRGAQRNDLRLRNNVLSPSGIYRCEIPTNASSIDDTTMRDIVYVGLYGMEGALSIDGSMTLTVDSDLNGVSPQFTLTCISTGGPATTVTWTRDSVTVTEGTETVLDDPVTAQYTHTLTVTGRLGGLYTCTIANDKPSNDSANFTIQISSAPTNVMAVQNGPTSIRVTWSPSNDATGYIISYYNSSSSDRVNISDGSTNEQLLTGLQNGGTYIISIVATSEHFFSDNVTVDFVHLVPGQPNVSVDNVTAISISLSWSVPSDSVVTSYEVMWKADEMKDEGNKTITESTKYTISDLRQGTSYSITVSAINSAGTSTNAVTAQTEGKNPFGNVGIVVDPITATSISLSWTSGGLEGVSYEVMWISDECSDNKDEGNATIMTGGTISGSDINGTTSGSDHKSTETNGNTTTDGSDGTESNGNTTTDESEGTESNGNITIDGSDDTESNGNTTTDESEGTESNGNITIDGSDDTESNGNTTTNGSDSTESNGNNTITDGSDSTKFNGNTTTEGSDGTESNGNITTDGSDSTESNGNITTDGSDSTESNGNIIAGGSDSNATTSVYNGNETNSNTTTSGSIGNATRHSSEGKSSTSSSNNNLTTNGFNSNTTSSFFNGNATNSSRSGDSITYTIMGLREGTSYIITVRASTGHVLRTHSRTKKIAPSAAPSSVDVLVENSTAITVQWEMVPCIDRNGDITGYSVQYTGGGSTQTMAVSGDSSGGMVTISGLSPITLYTVTVVAVNSAGTGVYSSPVMVTTPDIVYLSLNGDIIPNHAYVVISDIGSTNAYALICHTDRPASNSNANPEGDWFAPDGDHNVPGFRINRAPMIIRLLRGSGTPAQGIYHCSIEAMSDQGMFQNVYVGLHRSGEGAVSLSGGVTFTLNKDMEFTLTCNSSGGPPTTITWTRDSETINDTDTEAAKTEFVDGETAQYTHTLIVTGRMGGLYTCTVTNEVSSESSAALLVQAPSPPTDVDVSQNGLGSVLVSWTSGGADVTGYTIYYQYNVTYNMTLHSIMVEATLTNATITGLIAGVTYSINVVANSTTLPSTVTTAPNITIDPAAISLTSSSSSIMAGDTITLTCSVTLPSGVTNTPVFQWEGPGVTPTPADPTTSGGMVSSDLILSEISTSQAGLYTCTATLDGSNATSIIITVQIPAPTLFITVSTTDRTAGTTLSLTCDYALSPSVDTTVDTEVVWTVNGSPVATSEDSHISTAGVSLLFSPLTTSDTGTYTCTLTITTPQTPHVTVQGPVESEEEVITVQIPQPSVDVTLSRSAPLYAGTSLTLTCTVTLDTNVNNNESVVTEWSGPQSIPGDRYSVTPAMRESDGSYTGSLTISPLADQNDDDDTYVCTVTVNGGTQSVTASDDATITVTALPPPVVTISPASGVPTAGQTYSLTCSVAVVPHLVVEPSIQWSRQNGGVVSTSSGTSLLLSFNPLMTSDGDRYICRGSVDITSISVSVSGEESSDLIVTIPQPTVVIMKSHSGTVYVGTEFTLTASITFTDDDVRAVDVDLTLDISWTRGSDVIISDSHITVSDVSGSDNSYTASLAFSPITTDDNGSYTATVTVRNTTTSQYIQTVTVTDTERVDVRDLPDPVVTISGVSDGLAGDELSLTCTVTVVEYLTVVPTVQWSGGSVGLEDGVTESDTSHDGVNSMRTLTFSPLHTSHVAEYTCQAEISISSISVMMIATGSERVMVQIPRPVVMVYGSEMELVSGLSLTLTCSITRPSSVDTPTTVMSSWTAPNSTYNTVNAVNDTSVELMISSVETVDSGDYICSATLTDSSGSGNIINSETGTETIRITVKLNATVSANYTAVPGENPDDLGPNEFTAGSILILNCIVQGNNGSLTYKWSVTGNPDTSDCSRCTIIGPQPHTSTLRLAEPALNSYHAGIYTCTVSESGRPDSGHFAVTVVGAGIYSTQGAPGFISRPIANNGLMLSGSEGELRLECVSSQSALGVITGLDGNTLNSSSSIWTVGNLFGRPGVLYLKTDNDTSLTAAEQGIYTCTVPDNNDNQTVLNVGLYLIGFMEGPIISSLTYQGEQRRVICLSTGSPATAVSWMKDGQPLITDDSTDYTLTQTVTDRRASTYSNVLTVSEGVSVPGIYTCTVTNDLGSDSSVVVVVGITITGLETAPTVGQNATISCMTNIAVDSIEWRDQSSVLNMSSAVSLTLLEYTIPLVRDDLQGQEFTCTAMAGDAMYMESVEISVAVPADSLVVETVVSEDGLVEAGSTDLTLTCTVSEVISGLTNMPSAHWSGPVTSGHDIAFNEILRNAMTVTVGLTFSSLHTSHAGQYRCQGTLVSPAAEDNITSTSNTTSVSVRLPTPTMDLSVPSGPLYEGTSQTLNCTVTLPDTVDTDVNVTVQWTHNGTMTDVMISDVSSMRSPFISTLTLSPLSMSDAGQYSCVATADSSSQYIAASSQGNSSDVILNVTALPAPNINITFSGNSIAGQNYSLQCSASVVAGLVVMPDLEIMHPNTTVISVMNSSSSVEYMFSPLRTSNGGQYTCTATINIPQAGITDLNTSEMENVTVAIPEPTVTFTGSPTDISSNVTTLYSGTVFTLTCVVELVSVVDTNVTVLTSWTKNDTKLNSTSRISVDSEAMLITTSMYGSDVVFTPLSNRGSGDDGNYTCSAEVRDSEYITGSSSSGTQAMSVEGLDQPLVNVTTEGVSAAGKMLSLICTVETVEGVRPEDISITWIRPNETLPIGEDIENLSTTGSVTTGSRLEFSPLRTSDSGEYACVGSIFNMGTNVSGNDSEKITVTIPAPNVSLSLNTTGTVYQGTELVITCTVTKDSAVDTEYDINMTWRSDPADVRNGTYVNISDTSDMGLTYASTVTIRPVNTTDSANYTCTATVITTDSDNIVSSTESSSTLNIEVNELLKPDVHKNKLNSIAGQNFSVECEFTIPENVFRAPSVEWLNSTGHVKLVTSNLTFSPLLTSDGGEHTCNVTINIPELGVVKTGVGNTTLTVQIPTPTVVIEAVGEPFNGSEYILTCIVTVDKSVNTNITISSQWLNDTGPVITDSTTISNNSENIEWQHNLTFSPLRSEDRGVYTCTATISPEDNTFINRTTNKNSIEVKQLPELGVEFTISSSAGSGESSCLNVTFTDVSNTLTCAANVVPNLLDPPNILIMNEDSTNISTKNFSLTHNISSTHTEVFTCSVCIEVPEAGMMDHCTNDMIHLSRNVPEQITPMINLENDSNIVIDWSGSDSLSEDIIIVRFVVDVREYLSDGPGKTKTQSITGYPREIPGTELNHTVVSLKPEVPYDVRLLGANTVGCGPTTNTSPFFTKEGVPSAPRDVKVERLLSGTAMNVSFTRLTLVEARSLNVAYTVVYSLTPLLNRQSNMKRVPDNASHVVIRGLDPSATYHVIVVANSTEGKNSSSQVTLQPGLSSGNVVTGVVVTILTLLALLVVGGVAGFIIWRRRSRPEVKSLLLLSKKRGLYNIRHIKDSELENRVSPISHPPQSSEEMMLVRLQMDVERMRVISVDEFEEHGRRYHERKDTEFEREYETLAVGSLAPHEISQQLYNKPKNRFANIFPYDDSRVRLDEIPGVEESDYINASWINGYKHPNAYIASQGPKETTVDDFWRMVWQYKISHIVMLTGVCEGGRRKCAQYWCEEVGEGLEMEGVHLSLITTSITTHRDFVIRTMNLKNITEPDEKPLSVTQYHFTSWPDHGVPKFATSLISFIRRVQKVHNKDDGVPLLVHCSAGVGRTGTFILLDSMLERIKAEKTVNVYEFLVGLRQKRVLMVQTLAQYVFVHDALCEVIQCGDTEISASKLGSAVETMAQSLPGKVVTGFEEQFQVLDQVSRKPVEGDMIFGSGHASKNRYSDRLPYAEYAPCLRPEPGEEAYINASLIDGYKYHRAYIATQGPLQNTVGDLWRMMWEFKSKVMVMLCSFTEDGHEACHPFWPNNEGDTAKYGKTTVTLQSQNPFDEFTIRKLFVEGEEAHVEGFVMTQFHMSGWPEHGRPASTGSVVEMLDIITKAQMSSGNHTITVLCNDGVGRTGTFICLHSQLERLKTEGVVDFFQAVKSARIQRAGLLPDADQYAYCHEVLADFCQL